MSPQGCGCTADAQDEVAAAYREHRARVVHDQRAVDGGDDLAELSRCRIAMVALGLQVLPTFTISQPSTHVACTQHAYFF